MKELSFEKALEKLEKIVDELEEGNLSLDDSLKKYEEGIKLTRTCQQKLEKAKARIEVLLKDTKGDFSREEFGSEE